MSNRSNEKTEEKMMKMGGIQGGDKWSIGGKEEGKDDEGERERERENKNKGEEQC